MRKDDGPKAVQHMREAQRGGRAKNSWLGTPPGGGTPTLCHARGEYCPRTQIAIFLHPRASLRRCRILGHRWSA